MPYVQRTGGRGSATLDGDDEGLAPESRIDPDLARRGATVDNLPTRRVTAPRKRLPNEVPIFYLGRRRGTVSDQQIDLVVPDEENDASVSEISAMLEVPQVDENGQVRETPPVLTGDRFHRTGPSYHFVLNEVTLVAEEDAPFFLGHSFFKFERAEVEAEPPLMRRSVWRGR